MMIWKHFAENIAKDYTSKCKPSILYVKLDMQWCPWSLLDASVSAAIIGKGALLNNWIHFAYYGGNLMQRSHN
jgi:hypothetical protein